MVDSKPSTLGYFSITLELEGNNLAKLEQEAGGHRIQRVPPTERSGRVHTSTVTVAVLDKLEKQTIEIKDKDLQIDWFSGTGAGGQHRNKHQNSCRLMHKPTGIVATAQTRSRENSYKLAYEDLVKRLADIEQLKQHNDFATLKRSQVGSGMRGDKIRTVRFQDDQANDHRTGKRIRAENYMRGHMDRLWS